MEVLSRVAVLTDEAGRGAYRREYDRLQKSHTTVSEPFPVHRHHQRDRPRRWRRGRRVELDGRSGRSGRRYGGVPMTGGSRGSKQQTARSWTYGHEHEQHAQPSPRARRAGNYLSRSSGRTRIASFLHSSFLFSISEVGGTQVPRYCLGTTEARTARGKSRRHQIT